MSRLTLPCFEHLAYILLNSSVLANRLSTCTRYSFWVPEQWWLNSHGGTSCLWTCLCSLEEPSSCLYRSLAPVTQVKCVHKWLMNTAVQARETLQKVSDRSTYLSPHLPNILENHVAMPIKGSHATKQLLVVPAVDKNLRHKRQCIIRTRSSWKALLQSAVCNLTPDT